MRDCRFRFAREALRIFSATTPNAQYGLLELFIGDFFEEDEAVDPKKKFQDCAAEAGRENLVDIAFEAGNLLLTFSGAGLAAKATVGLVLSGAQITYHMASADSLGSISWDNVAFGAVGYAEAATSVQSAMQPSGTVAAANGILKVVGITGAVAQRTMLRKISMLVWPRPNEQR